MMDKFSLYLGLVLIFIGLIPPMMNAPYPIRYVGIPSFMVGLYIYWFGREL